MRAFLIFFLQLAGSIILGALIAYPAFLALEPFFDFKFHRVASRCMMFFLLISLVYVLRRCGVADRRSLGYGEPQADFLRHLGLGIALGVAMIAPLVLMQFLLGLRIVDPGGRDALDLLEIAMRGLVAGIVIGFLEETYFRGAMYSAIERDGGVVKAVLLSSMIYAVLHFFTGKYLLRISDPGWFSGLTIAADAAARFFFRLDEILDSLLALFAVGVLLTLVRWRTGTIAWAIGLHAGWVVSIGATKKLSRLDPEAPGAFLIGSYDGIIGYLALAWMLCLAPLVLLLGRGRNAGSRTDPQRASSLAASD